MVYAYKKKDVIQRSHLKSKYS